MKRRPVILAFSGKKLLLMAAVCLLLLLGLFWNGHSQAWPVVNRLAAPSDADLRSRIELLAKQYNSEPIDAKNDSVWKAIPGLNGLQLDVEASLQAAKKSQGERIPLVFKQIPPKVSLNDLGAQPIYRGNPQKKQMALMINVAWGTEYIPEILNILDQYHIKATFFLDGSWTSKNQEVAKEILARGHELGNHAYTHPDMSKMGPDATTREIVRTNQVIKQATGQSPKLFAPPSGAFNQGTVKIASANGMRTILWTLDTIDWQKPPAGTIVNRIVPRAQNGALVLMHPTAPTRDALRTIIPALEKKGYRLVTVSELLDQTRPEPTS